MTPFTLATWNINSVRLRAPHVASFVKEAQPDVIALQEIKCLPDQFPRKEFEEMGFPHLHIVGQKG
ncbi:MAG TPA: exodeoxyribonuclease III, partial [Oceanicaulis sp.]|nr:exodeoxyribonuclease III [Oceanicaulis sp.]